MLHLQARMNLLFASGPAPLEVAVSLKIGSLTGLCGPSGSGKTTLLRILAGLTMPEKGIVRVGERTWLDTEHRINLATQQRKVGMVFQDAALFPNMSVRQNVEFAAENRRDPIVDELLERVGLTNLADRKPATLSGGQRQRVALIRALARRPQVLLLDEPFSALDRETRDQLLIELLRLHRQFGTTTVLVSHHQEEIQRVADQFIELKEGKASFREKKSEPDSASRQQVSGLITGIDVKANRVQVQIWLNDATITVNRPHKALKWQVGDTITLDVEPATTAENPTGD
ncbi:sulfate/molybdate ABC transporter ATP-binding protein [Larkinella knui]|uniref:ATP-binding cassette domain-containing protein n=1 Tax=Larkinella knui TaxID=2025310 RepID=A0A3P1CJL0_9BACT|nr:ATP-binding cassette domain-containing protein [Larkinella knui]RRB13497.1 ATP-binding cassette domain-containing protein [Larkinella knui]